MRTARATNSETTARLRRALEHAPRPARGAVLGPERLRGAPVRVDAREQRRAPAAEGLGVACADVGPVEPAAEARGWGVGSGGGLGHCGTAPRR